jgi:transposase
MAIEIAWCWVRYQPDSELTRWWVRFANNGRSRRVGIVAVARKLLVAMWRYLESWVSPSFRLSQIGGVGLTARSSGR